MDEAKKFIHVDMSCPECGEDLMIETDFIGTDVYDQSVVPMVIAKDMLNLHINCLTCDELLYVSSTHPANLTLILYKGKNYDDQIPEDRGSDYILVSEE